MLDAINSEGFAFCDKESWLCSEFRYAYDWMAQQTRLHLGNPPLPQIKYPLWCWVQYNCHKSRKPKFTPSVDIGGKHKPEIFIEFEIPEDLLLQSNFLLWAAQGLNGWPIGDCKLLEKEIEAFGDIPFNDFPYELKQRISDTWKCIFNLNYRHRKYHTLSRRNTPIQATFWLLRKEWIKDIRTYIPHGQ